MLIHPKYDFNTLSGIERIKLPEKSVPMQESPEYMLQLEASKHFGAGNDELAFACLRKSNELMSLSPIVYPAKTYCRLVRQLKLHNRFEEAADEEAKLRKSHPEFFDGGRITSLKRFRESLASAKKLGTDLLAMSAHEGTCGECAKYQGRVFSISGNNKAYPQLPRCVYEFGGIHLGCRHTFHPHIEGESSPYKGLRYCNVTDVVSFSNRPFIDDRSPEDIALNMEYVNKHKQYLVELLGDDDQIRTTLSKKKRIQFYL